MRDKYIRQLKTELVDGEFENLVKGEVQNPRQLYETFKALKDEATETLLGVYLTDSLEGIIYSVLSIGGEKETLALPHEVLRLAILSRAPEFAVVHNHPAGDPTPSLYDKQVIVDLQAGAGALKLGFLDFIIVGNDSYWSMFEEAGGEAYSPRDTS